MKPNYPLSDMIRQDLESVAKSLPQVDDKDHVLNIIRNYEIGGWHFVDDYVTEIKLIASPQPPQSTISTGIGEWLSKGFERLTELLMRVR